MVDNEGLSKQYTQKLISEHKVKMVGVLFNSKRIQESKVPSALRMCHL